MRQAHKLDALAAGILAATIQTLLLPSYTGPFLFELLGSGRLALRGAALIVTIVLILALARLPSLAAIMIGSAAHYGTVLVVGAFTFIPEILPPLPVLVNVCLFVSIPGAFGIALGVLFARAMRVFEDAADARRKDRYYRRR